MSAFGLMRQGKRALSPPFEWPGTEGKGMPFVFRVLTRTELQEAKSAAYERMRELKLPPNETIGLLAFHDELATQILARACREAGNPDRPYVEGPEVLREHATDDECAVVVEWFAGFQGEVDPTPMDLTPAVFAALLDLVKKKDRTGLSAFGSSTLAGFLVSMDNPPSTSLTGSS